MSRSVMDYVWLLAFVVLAALAIPWFLWGDVRVVAGLPVWLWWHVGWMCLAAAVFYAFTLHGWDRVMGVERG